MSYSMSVTKLNVVRNLLLIPYTSGVSSNILYGRRSSQVYMYDFIRFTYAERVKAPLRY